ncbi:aconitase [Caldanaerobius fijiensis DSM 17918]|uniref:Aconitase n=1 Tax=Caldanaerobius fijiensis DSM 17918 TaxID=1121256 RepID=A0A1M4TRB1_9THEO|nr:aconitate hydratase [Caldanaerobius fijiensis]SHE46925.1 aconitase [Caldanaerobius fijiensis DSM 17918]
MGYNIVQKILKEHLVSGSLVPGHEIAIKIDQTLTQDSTGTMAYLQFEAMGISRVKTKLSVAYVDHNMLQEGFENADDHKYIQTVASKHGIYFSRPGNGICHQVHLERFGVPGETLLGSDSHTPTNGALGMIAIGAGGLDVAVAMGGGPYYLIMPRVINVRLHGSLRPWVSAKDIILELLRRLTVKGGVGKIIEYSGDGIKTLTVPERATIANMGAELGATTSVFPSDEITRDFLNAQGRLKDWKLIEADEDAEYDEVIDIYLDKLEPLIAQPHSPDNVVKVKELEGLKVDQVAIGSCTNSSYMDMMKVAAILKGKTVHPDVSLVISPGSRQVFQMLAKNGALADMVAAGARILECACGPCIGMGQAPATNAVSIRTFNRNFEGRSGTKSAKVYLASPEVAATAAIYGCIKDPRIWGKEIQIRLPERFEINDNMIIPPSENPDEVEVVRGPNIKPFPSHEPLSEKLEGEVLLKVGDNITTDHIMPSNARLLPFRSNIPKLSEHCFEGVDPDFSKRAKEKGGGFIVGGANYGQGSSREHAALVPLYLGIKFVLAKSFARIHKANLINNGILPLTFVNEEDYDEISQGDVLVLDDAVAQVRSKDNIVIKNITKGKEIIANLDVSDRNRELLIAGGLLNYTSLSNR